MRIPKAHNTRSNWTFPLKNSGSLKINPPMIIGKDNKKENRVASPLERPRALEIVSVEPERLTPGKMAMACMAPIHKDLL